MKRIIIFWICVLVLPSIDGYCQKYYYSTSPADKTYQKRVEQERVKQEKELELLQAVEKAHIEKADSLRKCFISNPKLHKRISDRHDKSTRLKDSLDREVKQLEAKRLTELDRLEKQYAGRLVGEIFRTKKAELDQKYATKVRLLTILGEAEVDNVKAFEGKIVQEFNQYLQENEIPVVFGEFIVLDSEIKPIDDYESFYALFHRPVFVSKYYNGVNYGRSSTTNYYCTEKQKIVYNSEKTIRQEKNVIQLSEETARIIAANLIEREALQALQDSLFRSGREKLSK